MRCSTGSPPAASGGCYRRSSRPAPRCSVFSTAGVTMGRGGGSATNCSWPPARPPVAGPVRQRGARQPVGEDVRSRWLARLRCRQEDQAQEAPCLDRYQQLAGRGHRARRRHPGSQRCGVAVGFDSAPFPGSGTSSPMVAIPAPSSRRHWQRPANGLWRSSSNPMPLKASSCGRDAGWSSGPRQWLNRNRRLAQALKLTTRRPARA